MSPSICSSVIPRKCTLTVVNIAADLLHRAEAVARTLSRSLAAFENRHLNGDDVHRMQERTLATWRCLIDDARVGRVSLDSIYLGALHRTLVGDAVQAAAARFDEGSPPFDWSSFVVGLTDANGASIRGAEAWVIAQLSWGDHVAPMSFSLGWLVVNGLRLQEGLAPICPQEGDFTRLAAALAAAGPPDWDAETLRALLGEYESAASK